MTILFSKTTYKLGGLKSQRKSAHARQKYGDYCSSPCTFRSHPADWTIMPLRELSHAACLNSRTL